MGDNMGKKQKNKLSFKRLAFFIVAVLIFTNVFLIGPMAQSDAINTKYAMSYVYFGTASQQIQNVTSTNNSINTVSPSYFNINSDGTLKLNNVSLDFINAMRKKGIKVVPFLSNHWDNQVGIAALNNIENLSNSIADAINTYNLDGVNIDIENVTELQREKYTLLVASLRSKIPAEKEVSVAVAANPNNWTKGWHGSYDYAALASYADHIFIMAYDEHYSGGSPGPVASIGFVEKSIQYALKYVPSEKIVLGIPFFGRVWSQDGRIKGLGISLDRLPEIMEKYQYSLSYDNNCKSPKIEFVIKSSDATTTINGVTLKPGSYTYWYENSDSLKEKLSLVTKYKLKGAGNWSLGQETSEIWDYYKNWLNGIYFNDISYCFAKDDIVNLSSQGIIKGVSEYEFMPNKPLSRGEVAAIVTRVMGLSIDENSDATYYDTTNNWAKNEIEAATKAGILKGYQDNKFRPEDKISRAEMAAIIARILKTTYSLTGNNSFIDIDSLFWAYNDILTLSNEGIINGYTDGTFKPFSQITRAEGAALINRAIGKM